MKLIVCILQDRDKDPVTDALIEAGYRVTVLPSTGAYLRRGNSTLLIGLDDEQVNPAIETIKENCQEPDEPGQKRATLFVMPVERFERV